MKTVTEVYFSPTGGTQRVCSILAGELGAVGARIDLSVINVADHKADTGDLVVIAMPVYGGRLPVVAVERMREYCTGRGRPCVVVAVYGLRAVEDALIELADVASECGFVVVAAVSAIAQHSIISKYGAGRPNITDETMLRGFARQIKSRESLSPLNLTSLPGNRPYKQIGKVPIVPKTTRKCNGCNKCVSLCPVRAIDPQTLRADKSKCISCMRCLRYCSRGGRSIPSLLVSLAALKIRRECIPSKKPLLYF